MRTLNEYVMQASNFHSAKLNEYLSTKVKDVKSIENQEFPKTPKLDDVVEFFRNNNFTEIEYRPNFDVTYLLNSASYDGKDSFVWWKSGNDYNIRFCKAQDPRHASYTAYFLRLSQDGKINDEDIAYIETWICSGKKNGRSTTFYMKVEREDKMFDDYDEFVDVVKNEFGW